MTFLTWTDCGRKSRKKRKSTGNTWENGKTKSHQRQHPPSFLLFLLEHWIKWAFKNGRTSLVTWDLRKHYLKQGAGGDLQLKQVAAASSAPDWHFLRWSRQGRGGHLRTLPRCLLPDGCASTLCGVCASAAFLFGFRSETLSVALEKYLESCKVHVLVMLAGSLHWWN